MPAQSPLRGEQADARRAAPLRVGVLLDHPRVQPWIARMLDGIVHGDFATLELFVLNTEQRTRPPRRALIERVTSPRPHLLYEALDRQDGRSNARRITAYLPRRDIAELYPHVRLAQVVPVRTKPWECRFDADTIEMLRAADLDVIIRLGFQVIRGEILDVPRFGVWSFHGGDSRHYRGRPSFFWEISEGNPVSGSVLQVLSDELDGGRVIYRSITANDPRSLWLNRGPTHWKNSDFVIRRLRDLHTRGWGYIESLPSYRESVRYEKPIYRIPQNRAAAKFAARSAGARWGRAAERTVMPERGCIEYRPRREGTAAFSDLSGFRVITPPPGRSWREPALLAAGGKEAVFFTDDATRGGGNPRISYLELGASTPPPARPVLGIGEGTSHPFPFTWNGDQYLVAHRARPGPLELFKAVRFPERFEHAATLVEHTDAVGATIHVADGIFWLFANVPVPGARYDDELRAYWSESLFGEWTAHPDNPIVSDVRSARPAGRLLDEAGALLRPARDAARPRRESVTLRYVTVLDRHEYREEEAGRLEAGSGSGELAIHSYDRSERFEVIGTLRRLSPKPRS